METTHPFGFVTGCYSEDQFHVQATLASMRYYCPQVPICLVVDGDFDIVNLAEQYDLIVLRISDLQNERMKQRIAGSHRAKLAAIWEGPFDFGVWLDSDAIVWGDFTTKVRTDLDFHIFWKDAEYPVTPSDPSLFKNYYFDPDLLKKFDSTFQWEANTYFSSGTFGYRKGVISFDQWEKVEGWLEKEPNLFAWGEMGMLNYLVHSLSQKREIKVDSSDLQHIWSHHGAGELNQDLRAASRSNNEAWVLPSFIERPRVAHFCGKKPNLLDKDYYSLPFSIARVTHYRQSGLNLPLSLLYILLEDLSVYGKKGFRKLKRLFKDELIQSA